MPTRPNQHKLEDLSRVKFQLALPKRWVYRDKDKDYGIDGEVELFDDNDKAQGILFYIQLKASESENESTIMNVDFSIETLKYYKKLDIPVLLVRYSEFKDCIYAKWIYNVDLFFSKDEAKTFRIKLVEKNLWTAYSSIKIEKRLINLKKIRSGYFNFPIPYTLTINSDNIQEISNAVLQTQVKKELGNYSDTLGFVKQSDSAIEITLDNVELKINIFDLTGCSFHDIDERDSENFAKGISKDILLGLASSMLQIGQIDYCGKVIFENDLSSRLIEKKDLLIYMLPALFKSSYFEEVLELIGDILDSDFSIEVSIISTVNILISSKSNSKSKIKAIENFLKKRLSVACKRKDETQIGVTHYNLGNHYRGRSKYYESIANFVSAKRHEPKYLKQDYFYSEIAGVLFLTEKYQSASRLYHKAIELGADGLTRALYADALMFSGEYQKAVDAFLEYLKSVDEPSDEFLLKSLCLEGILDEKNIKVQKRDLMLATSKADLSKLDKTTSPKAQLDKSLDIDLLCGLAWFNYGIIQSEDSDYEAAIFSFIMAGIVQNNDIEAWKNATLCSFKSKNESAMFALIIRTAYSYNGEDYLEQFYTHLEQKNSTENISKLLELIELILPKRDNKIKSPVVRMINEDGKFENIFKE